jgi:ATP-binding cassette subfamily B protein
MIFSAIAEVFSIGMVIPFLGALINPEKIIHNESIIAIFRLLNINDSGSLVLIFAFAFGAMAIIAGIVRLFLLWSSAKVAFLTGADLSYEMYRKTLYQPYQIQISRNSSEIVNILILQSNEIIYGAVMPVITIISSAIMLMLVLGISLYVNPLLTILCITFFSFLYVGIVLIFRKKLLEDGERVTNEASNLLKNLQESLGGIRDILVDGTQEIYCRIYQQSDLALRCAQGSRVFIGQSPRYLMEAIGMLAIAVAAYGLALVDGGLMAAIPILGALALGAQKLLPILQQIYVSWSSIQGSLGAVEGAVKLLEQPLHYPEALQANYRQPPIFANQIILKGLWFSYQKDAPWVLKGVDLTILKGERIGFVGKTGGGKSTLVDVLMGLLKPTRGEILIDGMKLSHKNLREWQNHIAHVPQVIYLADCSIAENIAFGVPFELIDYERVRLAARQSQIEEMIEIMPEKYKTKIGERGIFLSGGQRQRLGIARALYKKADVIIFDEATSALDQVTEAAVMETIFSINKNVTILMIAHRITTLKSCSRVFEISNGNLKPVNLFD